MAPSHETPGATRSYKGQRTSLPLIFRRDCDPTDTLLLDFWPPDSERIDVYCISHTVCGDRLQRPRKSAQAPSEGGDLWAARPSGALPLVVTWLHTPAPIQSQPHSTNVQPTDQQKEARPSDSRPTAPRNPEEEKLPPLPFSGLTQNLSWREKSDLDETDHF